MTHIRFKRLTGPAAELALLLAVVCVVALVLVSKIVTQNDARECRGAQAGSQVVELCALWYGRSADSTVHVGGIIPVSIRYSPDGEGLDIDVDSQKESGAGPRWVAAAWLGATTSVLNGEIDPATVHLVFEVGEDIDGPSAGGLMAVGVAAALRGDPVRADLAITGTIAIDGSIGDVGGLPYKIKGAADAGIKTVLIPSGQRLASDIATGEMVDLINLGESLNVEVREVADISQAYEIATGRSLDDDDPPANFEPITDKFETQLDALTDERLGRVSEEMRMIKERGPHPGAYGADWLRRVDGAIARATLARSSGEAAVAYASAMTADLLAVQCLAARLTEDKMDQQGAKVVRNGVAADARRVDRQARAQVRQLAEQGKLPEAGQAVAYGDAISWAITGGLVANLTAGGVDELALNPGILQKAAAAIARSEVYLKASHEAVSLSSRLQGNFRYSNVSNEALADLTWEAGSAAIAYLDNSVVPQMADESLAAGSTISNFLATPDADYVYVQGIEAYVDKLTAGLDPAAAIAVRAAGALERYVYSSYLIAKYDTLQTTLDESGYASRVGDRAQLEEYAGLAQQHLDELMAEAAAAGLDVSYIHLLTEWGESRYELGKAADSGHDEMEGLAFLWRAFVLGQVQELIVG
jgi:hypothetical protein